MIRLSASTGVFVAAMLASVAAGAETRSSSDPGDIPQGPAAIRQRLAIVTPPEAFLRAPHAQISPTLYLERCIGGCKVKIGGVNDARTLTSTIPDPGANCPNNECTITEYEDGLHQSGVLADAEWNLVVQCMKEVYSPFQVVITDVKPVAGSYHAAIIGGIPQNINFDSSILGVAPLSSDCSPQDNVISFSFANAHSQTETISRVNNICWTAAQESAHAFGLDHQYSFIADNRSACNDPMTYRVDCGGEKFFRNDNANCGEDKARPCRCGTSQNSHLKLFSVFGAGQSIVPAPTTAITTPAIGVTTLGPFVAGRAVSKRGVAKVELFLNDFKWGQAKGAPFGQNGQDPVYAYKIDVPGSVPNSIIDIKLRAYDDLGNYGDSQVVTVTKGAPCASADTCAVGQRCEAGKCFWDPPAGEIGDSCTYPQFCLSNICQGTAEKQICTQECIPGVEDSCPPDMGLTCIESAPGKGVCFFSSDTGCCSVGHDDGMPWAQLGFAAMMFGVLVWPWRRRR